MNVDVVVPGGAALGECPIWSVEEHVLYWIDIEGRAIHRFDPATGGDERKALHLRPGSMVATASPGRFLVGAETELGWFEWDAGSYTHAADCEPAGTGNRLNDGRTDRQGRFWLGSMYEDTAARRSTGILHRVDPGLEISRHRDAVGVTNGIAFSPDGTTMYFADSFEATVWAYEYDTDTGERSNERVFTDFTGLPGGPDGACVDADGCYWVACVRGWAVARLTPDGAIDRVIEVPVEKPSMAAFGGSGLDTLYVTSISMGTTQGTDQPHAGGVLAIDVGVRGIAETPFAG